MTGTMSDGWQMDWIVLPISSLGSYSSARAAEGET